MEGYLAFLDVLGFSALVADGSGHTRIDSYFDSLKRVTEPVNIPFVVFSDSIILTTKGDGEQDLLTLAETCSRLLYDLLEKDISIRGAIAFGDYVRKEINDSIFVAGRALIDAYRFEEAQNWVGVMLAPSALRRVPDLGDRCRLEEFATAPDPKSFEHVDTIWPRVIQRCAAIPFHEAGLSDFRGFAVVPTNEDTGPTANSDGVSRAIQRLLWLESLAPTPAAQYKYKHTLVWLSRIKSFWMMIEGKASTAGRH